jgi:hypothetical protein
MGCAVPSSVPLCGPCRDPTSGIGGPTQTYFQTVLVRLILARVEPYFGILFLDRVRAGL